MLRLAVCDDEPLFRRELIQKLENYFTKKEVPVSWVEYGDMLDLKTDLRKKQTPC